MNTAQQPVAIVTGASSGIGLGVTQALLERGWRVVATSRTIRKSKDLKSSPDLALVDGEVSNEGSHPTKPAAIQSNAKPRPDPLCAASSPSPSFNVSQKIP
jgi:NAD(P)-dependent dehydrogenase (short-subunit alcohol dehydrogenase family)